MEANFYYENIWIFAPKLNLKTAGRIFAIFGAKIQIFSEWKFASNEFYIQNGSLSQCVKRKCATPHANHRTWKEWSEPFNYPILLGSHTKLLNSCLNFEKIIHEYLKMKIGPHFSILRRSRILFPMPFCQDLPKDSKRANHFPLSEVNFLSFHMTFSAIIFNQV